MPCDPKKNQTRINTVTNLIKTSKKGSHPKQKFQPKKKGGEAWHGVERVSMLFFGLKKKSTVIF